MSAMSLRRGWCPGVLRPMEAGDGLLARVRPRHGRLSRLQAIAIADGAARFGNGAIDLSARGTLQIRGVSDRTLSNLVDVLAQAGLVDESEPEEAARNVILSPASDCDPAALVDARGLSQRVEPVIAEIARTVGVVSKFSLAVDDGGSFSLRSVSADIRLEAVRSGDGIGLRLAIAGSGETALPLGVFGEEEVLRHLKALYVAAARLFPARRPQCAEARTWAAEAGVPEATTLERDVVQQPAKKVTASIALLRPVFGRLQARQLAEAADCLSPEGPASFRPTIDRTLLVAPASAREQGDLLAFARREGFILASDDPLAHVSACVGAPACRNASTDVRADASAAAAILGGRLARTFNLHVSGCAKGCAHPAPAAITLTADSGRYRLAFDAKADGGAGPALLPEEMLAALPRLTGVTPDGSSAER